MELAVPVVVRTGQKGRRMTRSSTEHTSPAGGDTALRPDDGKDRSASEPQERVEDRENVSTVTPEDYPAEDRKIARPK